MKCPICDGKGSVYNALGDYNEDCGHCQGTGRVRVEGEPMTEQEWIQTADTEQLAELIALICGSNILQVWRIMYHCADSDVDAVKMWLKQPHTDKEYKE